MISSTGRESLQITKAVMRGWGKAFRQEEEEEEEEEEEQAAGKGEDLCHLSGYNRSYNSRARSPNYTLCISFGVECIW